MLWKHRMSCERVKRLTCSSSSSSSSSRCCVSSAEESLFTSSGNPSASELACVRLSLSRSLVARSLTRVYGLLRDARRSERIIARSGAEQSVCRVGGACCETARSSSSSTGEARSAEWRHRGAAIIITARVRLIDSRFDTLPFRPWAQATAVLGLSKQLN